MSHNNRPLILIGNDDGIDWAGIKLLTQVARHHGDVVVAAPMLHQSGKSSAITIITPLRAFKVNEEPGLTIYRIDGTPVDCIKLAFNSLLGGRRPNLVLSGINHGSNKGVSTAYSGTMGAAFEGVLHNVPSVAFSLEDISPNADFTQCLPWVDEIIGRVMQRGLPRGVCLNVNFPKGEIKGAKATTTSMGHWTAEYDHRIDPFGLDYYWLQGEYVSDNPDDDSTDDYWLQRGYASVTPCRVDQTALEAMVHVNELLKR